MKKFKLRTEIKEVNQEGDRKYVEYLYYDNFFNTKKEMEDFVNSFKRPAYFYLQELKIKREYKTYISKKVD